jgi:DNA-binding response OmpR family regulator
MTFAARNPHDLIPLPSDPASGRVLVLDTDPDRRALLADVVGRAGSEVALAHTGVEAIERLGTRHPDVVLVADFEDGSPHGFVAWARPRYPELALVALADDIEDATELYRLGADIVETLPLDPDRLGAKLAALMRRSAAAGARAAEAAAPVVPTAEPPPALAIQAA